MRLEGDFYTITDRQDDGCGYSLFTVRLNPRHRIYAGHFPGRAVLPGACAITIIRECAGLATGKSVMFKDIRNCKFISAVTPEPERETVLVIEMHISDGYGIDCSVRNGEKSILKIKGRIEAIQ